MNNAKHKHTKKNIDVKYQFKIYTFIAILSESIMLMFHLFNFTSYMTCVHRYRHTVEQINLNLQNVYAKHIFGCQQIFLPKLQCSI